jgi:MinD-like ATPase involved in chromosome partitioning or flagellar assembly
MKGGVGKTTLTVNLATSLAKYYQKKVLVLDLDSQISATLSLFQPHEFAKIRKKNRTLTYLLDEVIEPNPYSKLTIQDIIVPSVCGVEGLDLLPGDIELYDEYIISKKLHQQSLEQEEFDFEAIWDRFERVLLKKIIDPVRDSYDFIIMDCSPGYNLLTRSAIAASDYYILPARPEPLSIVGIQLLQRRIEKLRERHQNTEALNLKLLGIVFILSSGGLFSRYYSQVMKRVEEDFTPEQRFKTTIPMDVNVAKAVDLFTPVVLCAPTSSGAKEFVRLTQEILAKLGR